MQIASVELRGFFFLVSWSLGWQPQNQAAIANSILKAPLN